MALIHDFLEVSPDRLTSLLSLNKSLFSNTEIRYKNGDSIYWPSEHSDADDILYSIIDNFRESLIMVHDDDILSMLPNFEIVNTLFGGFIPYKGLNYYGCTLFPPESLTILISVLQSANNQNLNQLIQLCRTANKNKNYILHRGI